MAGKAGSAAEGMQQPALDAALLLERAMQTLIDAPAPDDGEAVETLAKQIKAVTDAGRSAVALEAACAKAAAQAASPSARRRSDPSSEEMDMDDEPRVSRSPAEVLQLRAQLARQLERLFGPARQNSAEGSAGTGRCGGGAGPVADHLPAFAASA